MAHLFLSYSRKNQSVVDTLANKLHEKNHTTWLDRRSIRLGDGWAKAIGRGIGDSDLILVAVSKEAINSEWVNREIAIAEKQHKPILPLLIGPVPKRSLPASLRKLQAVSLWPDMDPGIAKLLKNIGGGSHDGGRIPFLVDHPRLANFLGRDAAMRQLHNSLMTAGPTGIRSAGVSGMGGIGKTQLAVEYAHRYKYFYPDGIFMLNAAAANWTAELARVADRLNLPGDLERPLAMADAFISYLDRHRDSLVIFDNVAEVSNLRRKTIGRGSIAINLPCRVLFTTRQRFEGNGIQALAIDVLPMEDARNLLVSKRSDLDSSDPSIERVCESLGRLPLALALGAAFLQRKQKATPESYLAHLTRHGLDATHYQAQIKKGELEAYDDTSAGPALKAQWRLLESSNTVRVLEMIAQHEENTHVPAARVGLLCGFHDDPGGVVTPLGDALRDATVANLLEQLENDMFRLHPVVRDFVLHRRKRNWERFCSAARRRLIDAYEDLPNLEKQISARGNDEVARDLGSAITLRGGSSISRHTKKIRSLLRIIQREQHVLRSWQYDTQPAFLAQQVRKRAGELKLRALAARTQKRLDVLGLPYFSLDWRTGIAPRLNLVHEDYLVNECALLPDNQHALTVCLDGPLREWDLDTGVVTRSTSVGEKGANGLDVSSDGRIAIVAPEGRDPLIWDIERWETLCVLEGNGHAGWGVAMSPDGTRALTACKQGLKLWNPRTGKRLKTLTSRGNWVHAVAFTPDGKRAITGTDRGRVVLWDVEAGKKLLQLGSHFGEVWAVAVSADGRFACSGADDNLIAIWDLVAGGEPRLLHGHTAIVRALTFAPDESRLWSASGDYTLKLWDLRANREPFSVQAHSGYIRGLDVSADGSLVLTAAGDGAARVWDRHEIQIRSREPHGGPISFAGIPPDGEHVITAGWDGKVHVRNTTTGKRVRNKLDGYLAHEQIRSAAMTPDGQTMLLGCANEVLLWKAPENAPREIGYIELADSVALTPDGKLGICGSFPREVTLWDLERGKRKRTLLRSAWGPASRGPLAVYSVALSGDGRYSFASVEKMGVLIWDLRSGKAMQTMRKDLHDHYIACTPDGNHLVCASNEGMVHIVRIPKLKVINTLETGPVGTLTMSADGAYLATAGPRATLHVWDLNSGSCVASYGADSSLTAIAFGPNNESIIVGDDVGRLQMLRLNRLVPA